MLKVSWHISQSETDTFTDKLFELGLAAVNSIPIDSELPLTTTAEKSDPTFETSIFLEHDEWNRIQPFLPAPDSIQVSSADWLNAWCRDLKPVLVDDIQIQPLAADESVGPMEGASPILIRIDPRDSFGYGTHPTTHLCIQLLSKHRKLIQGKDVLDVGTGSGVLSLVAVALGASHALGIDNDQAAVESAKRNATLNQISNVEFTDEELDSRNEHFDVVIANVPALILEMLLPDILRRTSSRTIFILSGFLAIESAKIEKLFPTRKRKELLTAEDPSSAEPSHQWGAVLILS